ncbi:hypothetical protein NDU88_003074 [Pleurodeles waltl]|uniref:Uncharacterized protein n=1 Tax=Pleurodeles waltl TaxID=8319 RepID=A0AAV7RDA3_PLEWA|nr:hypothetical protein NDU88_003074 [Pleurodeles waltl]
MEGDCVRKALALLEKARRMDLVKREALTEEGDHGRAEPGEQRVALIPWREEKVEPRAAGRSSSTEGPARKKGAADAPKGRCGGMGFAPAGTAALGEQHPGPSGMRGCLPAQLADPDFGDEWQRQGSSTVGVQSLDFWCEDEGIGF